MIQALQLILALSILVLFHEFGHYITARIFGMKVSRFYLFFNPWFSLLKYYPDKGKVELIAWTKQIKEPQPDGKDKVVDEEPHALLSFKCGKAFAPFRDGKPTWAATMYGIGWLPLGGYCAIDGMVDETTGADELSKEPQPWEFRAKPAWQRLVVMMAGVVFNFILAIIIYAGIVWWWGEKMVPYDQAYEGMDYIEVLHEAGLQDGDILLSVNGVRPEIGSADDMGWEFAQPGTVVKVLRNHADTLDITMPAYILDSVAAIKEPLMRYRVPVVVDKAQAGMPAAQARLLPGDRIVKVDNDTTPSRREFALALQPRGGQEVTLGIVRGDKYLEVPLTLTDDAKLGIQMRGIEGIYPVVTKEYNIIQAVPRGIALGTNQLVTYVKSLKMLFTKTGVQQIGGFGTIGELYDNEWNWQSFWWTTAFLSVILAFMNIIPIPGLDGGHIMFTLWEICTGHKPSDRFLEIANTIGFAFLFLLLIYANGNDLLRYFLK